MGTQQHYQPISHCYFKNPIRNLVVEFSSYCGSIQSPERPIGVLVWIWYVTEGMLPIVCTIPENNFHDRVSGANLLVSRETEDCIVVMAAALSQPNVEVC